MTEPQTSSGGVEFVRTPDDRFAQLPDFPYPPTYVEVDGLRMAYVDDGPSDARAPFPSELFMAGARQFPTLVPITPEHDGVAENLAAWEILDRWEKPLLTLWCPEDPVLGQLHHEFIERVPGAGGQPHQEFRPGGHFLQDDRGEDVAAALVEWLR